MLVLISRKVNDWIQIEKTALSHTGVGCYDL